MGACGWNPGYKHEYDFYIIPGTSGTSLWRRVKQLETKVRNLDSQDCKGRFEGHQ